MKFIFLISAFNALFFTTLLVQKKPRGYHDNILILWLIYLGLFIATYSFFSHELFTGFRVFSNSFLSLFMLHGPFLYFYVAALAGGKRFHLPGDLVHFAPFFTFNLFILFASIDPGYSAQLNIETVSPASHTPVLYSIFLVLTALSGPFYFLLTRKLFRRLDAGFLNFSSSPRVSPVWLKILITVFGLVWTVLIIITVIHHVFDLFSMLFCTDGLFLSLSLFVLLIGYFGLKQHVIIPAENFILNSPDEKSKPKYAGSKLSEKESERFASDLLTFMKEKKPYLDPELTLAQLSERTCIPAHYLSQVINERFEKNFFDFINGYRVEAFISIVNEPRYSEFSLLGIAFECGFNSKSTFNRIFRQVTGKTPSEFKKSGPGVFLSPEV